MSVQTKNYLQAVQHFRSDCTDCTCTCLKQIPKKDFSFTLPKITEVMILELFMIVNWPKFAMPRCAKITFFAK